MGEDVERALQEGRAALERREWDKAFELLTAADTRKPLAPDDLEGLALASYWSGHLDAVITARERAHAAYLEAEQPCKAAGAALGLANYYTSKNAMAVGAGWYGTAQRLLADEPDCAEHGRLAFNEAFVALNFSGDLDHALERALTAYEIGTRFGDRDVQAQALHTQGRILVSQGHLAEGMALVDESMTATMTGRIGPLAATHLFCFTLTLCQLMADYARAGQWMDAADHCDERLGISGRARHSGDCQAHRADILRVRGRWAEAEEAAQYACDELGPGYHHPHMGIAKYEIGLIRLGRGDLDGSESAFQEAYELGFPPQPGLALLRLAQGKVDIAQTSIAEALSAAPPDVLRRMWLLPAFVEIALAGGDRETATTAVEEMEMVTKTYPTAALQGAAAGARGALQLKEGDAKQALASLRAAGEFWREAETPYEGARTRILLAESHRALRNVDDALLELRAARSMFEHLGAAPDVQRATMLIEEYEQRTAPASPPVARTLIFTDIVRSTNLVEAIGDAAWMSLLRWHDELLRGLFRKHNGEEVNHAGDGFFVAFPNATAAVACGIAIQRSLAEHRRSHGFAPQVRIGLHSDDVAKEGKDYRGRGVHLAARVAALAGGAEIVATEETARAAAQAVTSEPREVTLKGIGEAVRVVSIDWRRA